MRSAVTISPGFRIVIPKPVRALMRLAPGQKMQAFAYDDRIELIPVRPLREMRGFLRGIDARIPRERDRDL